MEITTKSELDRYFRSIRTQVSLIALLGLFASQFLHYLNNGNLNLIGMGTSLVSYLGLLWFLSQEDRLGIFVAFLWGLAELPIAIRGVYLFWDKIFLVALVDFVRSLLIFYLLHFSFRAVKLFIKWLFSKGNPTLK